MYLACQVPILVGLLIEFVELKVPGVGYAYYTTAE
jgi:hypothetical protein